MNIRLGKAIKKHFATGLLIFLPLVVTFSIITWLDNSIIDLIKLLPKDFQPETYVAHKVPGLGIVISVAVIYVVGFLGSVYLGRKIVRVYELVLETIPGVRWLYAAAKQILEAVFKTLAEFKETGTDRFRGVALLEYPRKGVYTIAFVTGDAAAEVCRKTGREMVNVFVPTTPNPTSGFFLLVPKEELTPLEMPVDKAFKLIISAGMVGEEK